MRCPLLAAALAIALPAMAGASLAESVKTSTIGAVAQPRKVMTWVAPYAIPQSLTRLRSLYSGAGPRNSITHLGLQFWTPTTSGGLQRSVQATITNATIQTFAAWGHSNGIKVLLCVYNGDTGWNWNLARAAFKTHQTAFIDALVREMQARGLDGIDIDLEGPNGNYEADKAAYVAFIRELARRVHLLHKIVTIDSFPYIWNGPNQNWWAALFPLVDGINSMGYEDLGRNAAGWRRYLAQKARAGAYSAKLQIGIPSNLSAWQGNTTLQQVQWFQTPQAGRVGIAIWDAQFPNVTWNSAPVWQALQAIRQD